MSQKQNRNRGRRNNNKKRNAPVDVSIVVGMISLGCAKNTADTERILGMLASAGFVVTGDTNEADIVLINTCAFIKEAREETIEVINGFPEDMPVIAIGCFPERKEREPENIDAAFADNVMLLGFEDYDNIVQKIAEMLGLCLEGESICFEESPRLVTGTPITAYLKVAEGCSNCCTYCAVPNIRGTLTSSDKDALLDEAAGLVEIGAKEICVIAQDVANYGRDIHNESKLVEFTRELAKINELDWIRLLYVHPAHLTKEIAELIATEDKVLPYIDLPIQHVSDGILKAMNRHHTKQELIDRIAMLRDIAGDIAIRTSVILGFPGETDEHFNELMEFVEATRFEHLGAFTYSREPGTVAYDFENQVPTAIAEMRANTIMELQQNIAFDILDSRLGKTEDAILEYQLDDGVWEGRTSREAPDVDGRIIVENVPIDINPAHIVQINLKNREEYDLIAEYSFQKVYK